MSGGSNVSSTLCINIVQISTIACFTTGVGLNYTCMVQSQGVPYEQSNQIGTCVGKAQGSDNPKTATRCLKAASPPLSPTQKRPAKTTLKCIQKYLKLMGTALYKAQFLASSKFSAFRQGLDDCLGNNTGLAACPFSQFAANFSSIPKLQKILLKDEKKFSKCYPSVQCTLLNPITTTLSTPLTTSITTPVPGGASPTASTATATTAATTTIAVTTATTGSTTSSSG